MFSKLQQQTKYTLRVFFNRKELLEKNWLEGQEVEINVFDDEIVIKKINNKNNKK